MSVSVLTVMPQTLQATSTNSLLRTVAIKRERLDALRPVPPEALANLEHYYNLELTDTSNAIEGNTLSPVETTLVIERGITVSGKSLKYHLEALDHFDAIRYVREIAVQTRPLAEADVRTLHHLVMRRSRPDIAGQYADISRYVRTATGRLAFPPAAEVPTLTSELAAWLEAAPDTPDTAFAAHLRLLEIHPFNDGNGRTARLLMNLILIRGGYPPIAVRPEDRLAYVRSLQKAQEGQGAEGFTTLLYTRLNATLGEYLTALQEYDVQFESQR